MDDEYQSTDGDDETDDGNVYILALPKTCVRRYTVWFAQSPDWWTERKPSIATRIRRDLLMIVLIKMRYYVDNKFMFL